MPDKVPKGKLTCDMAMTRNGHKLLPGNTESLIRSKPQPASIRLFALTFTMSVIVFSLPNVVASSNEIQQVQEGPTPLVTDSDGKSQEPITPDRNVELDNQSAKMPSVNASAAALPSESKLPPAATVQMVSPETYEPLPFQNVALSIVTWTAILLVVSFVIYEIVKALRSKVISPVAFLAIGVLLWFSSDMLIIRTTSTLVSAVAFLTITHHLHARRFRRVAFILGLFLGLMAFGCSVIGVLVRIERGPVREGQIESVSVAVYEATQALMMNMAPHDPMEDGTSANPQPEAIEENRDGVGSNSNPPTLPSAENSPSETGKIAAAQPLVNESKIAVPVEPSAERNWLTAARIFATLLAFFIAYQVLTHYSRNAIYRARMTWLWWKAIFGRPEVCLVCGVGYVGLRLVRELRQKGRNVVALEKNEEHANLKAAIDTGAIVLTSDATLIEALDDLPLIAIKTVYVICGDDTVNLEVAMNVKRMFDPKRNPVKSDAWSITAWTQSLVQWFVGLRTPSHRECFVQIFDTEMQKLLHQAFHSNIGQRGGLQFRPFNADLNAVRNLITDELTLLRPKATDEVAFYVVVGFDDRWKEVVHGLTQLAHFENRKRSRILVLTEDPERDSKSFVTRYPRCTVDNPIRPELADVSFCPLTDEWPSTFAGSAKGRTEAEYFRINDKRVKEVEKLDLQAKGPLPPKFVRCLVIRHADANKHLDCEVKFKNKVGVWNASQLVIDNMEEMGLIASDQKSKAWIEVEGLENDVRDFFAACGYGQCEVFKARVQGLEFVAQTLIGPSTFAGTAMGRTEAEYFRINDKRVAEFEKLHLQATDPAPPKFVRCLVKRNPANERDLACEVAYRSKVRVREASQSVIDSLESVEVITSCEKSKDWFEIEGQEDDVRAFLAACGQGQATVYSARRWGLEFATQTLFSTLPKVPGDDDFLTQLHRLIDEPDWQKVAGGVTEEKTDGVAEEKTDVKPPTRKIRPVMIVAGGDDTKNFTWCNSFAHHWERFRGRHCIQPPAVVGHGAHKPLIEILDLPVFVWISDQEPLRDLMDQIGEGRATAPSSASAGGVKSGSGQGNDAYHRKVSGVIESGCRSFGDPSKTAGSIAIHESFRRYLSQGVSDAYNYVTSLLTNPTETTGAGEKKPSEIPVPALKADPEQYDNQQSNNHAADHAIIKLAMLHEASAWENRWKEITVRNRELERTGELKEVMGVDALKKDAVLEIPMPDGPTRKVTRDDARLRVISEVEHYRWSAELLLRNANWHPTELAKRPVEGGGKARVPEAIHIRKTLCPWDQLGKDDLEQQKDIEQVWFILHAFDKQKK
jgi:hypothetical protein